MFIGGGMMSFASLGGSVAGLAGNTIGTMPRFSGASEAVSPCWQQTLARFLAYKHTVPMPDERKRRINTLA